MNRLILLIIYILAGVLICGMFEYNEDEIRNGLGFYTLMVFTWPIPVIVIIALYIIAYTYRFGKILGRRLSIFMDGRKLRIR